MGIGAKAFGRGIRRSCVLVAVAIAGLTFASQALAGTYGTASISGTTLRYDADPSNKNNYSYIYVSGGSYYVYDFNATAADPITAGAGCSFVGTTEVTCPSAGINNFIVNLQDGNDTSYLYLPFGVTTGATVYGGTGNDATNVIGSSTTDYAYIYGGAGEDLSGPLAEQALVYGVVGDVPRGPSTA